MFYHILDIRRKKSNKELFKSSGFTVLEIIIVLSLLSILFTISLPSLAHLRYSLVGKSVTQELGSQIRLAKIDALNSGKTTRVVFDTVRNQYIFTNGSGISTYHELPKEATLYRTNFPLNTLRFYATGTPSSGGTITVKAGKELKYIIVAPVTGRVRISDTPPAY